MLRCLVLLLAGCRLAPVAGPPAPAVARPPAVDASAADDGAGAPFHLAARARGAYFIVAPSTDGGIMVHTGQQIAGARAGETLLQSDRDWPAFRGDRLTFAGEFAGRWPDDIYVAVELTGADARPAVARRSGGAWELWEPPTAAGIAGYYEFFHTLPGGEVVGLRPRLADAATAGLWDTLIGAVTLAPPPEAVVRDGLVTSARGDRVLLLLDARLLRATIDEPRWQPVPAFAREAADAQDRLAVGPDGELVVSRCRYTTGEQFLARLHGREWQQQSLPAGACAHALQFADDGTLWLAADDSLYRRRADATWDRVPVEIAGHGRLTMIDGMLLRPRGQVWVNGWLRSRARPVQGAPAGEFMVATTATGFTPIDLSPAR